MNEMIFVLQRHDKVVFATADHKDAFKAILNGCECEVYDGRKRYARLKSSYGKIIFDECYIVSELTDLVNEFSKLKLSDVKVGQQFKLSTCDDVYTLVKPHRDLKVCFTGPYEDDDIDNGYGYKYVYMCDNVIYASNKNREVELVND